MNILLNINNQYYFQTYSPDLTYGHINTTYYAPRISNYPTISKKAGSSFFGLINIDAISISLINKDGYFDDFYDLFINKNATVMVGSTNDFGNYKTIFTGRITDIGNSFDSTTLTISDEKDKFKRGMKFNYYSTASYANINTKNINKPIPQMWGQNIKMPCICTNEMESPTPTNYTFKICDTTYNVLSSVDAVYLDNVTVSYANVNLTNGTFTIAASTLGSNNFDKVTASATNAMNNPVDIIQDIVDTAITGFNWDVNSMAVTALEGFVTSYYQNSVVDILTAITDITKDTDLILITDSLGYSKLKYFNQSRLVNRVIKNHEYTDTPSTSNNINEFVSSILITYSPSRSNDEKKYHRVATYEAEAETWFGNKNEISIDTNLVSTTDADFKANKILELSRIFRETFTRSIRLDMNDNIELFDFVAANPRQRDVNIDTLIYDTYEVLGVSDNYELMTRQLILRYITGYALVNTFDFLQDETLDYIEDENGIRIITGSY